MSVRGFRVRRLLVAALAWAIAFAALPISSADAAAACTAAQLVPNLPRFEINQGLGSYLRLTRGKNVFARPYFTLPPTATCDSKGQSITITAASLTVAGPSGTSSAITPLNATGLSSTNLALPPALADSNHDPKFLIDASVLIAVSPPATGTPPTFPSFTATFTVQVTYNRKLSSSVTNTGLTASFNKTQAVDRTSKAVRILFQPIGDGTSPTTQFTDADRTAVQNAVQTLLRLLPVPAGPAGTPLTAAGRTGGIRYDISPSLLDVSDISTLFKTPSGLPKKFCATQSGFTVLAPRLGTRLDLFNAAQPSADDAADYIVGVYGENVSYDSLQGCALGMATVNSKVSIARAVSDKPKSGGTPAQPSYTGAVMAQELTHDLAGQPSPRSSTYHSSYIQSDNTDPDGAYNLSSGTYIPADKTVMNVDTSTSRWDNTVTVLEKEDFEYVLCRFGGTANTECSTPIPGGTLTNVSAIDAYVAAGNTAVGLIEGYHASSPSTFADSSSPYHLQRFGPLGLLDDTRVPVSFTYSHHGDDVATNPPGLFAFALPSSLTSGVVEIKLVNTATGAVVFDVVKSTSGGPTVTEVTAESNDLLAPGQSKVITKKVDPPKNPDGDIVFFADTTGSMAAAINNVKTNAGEVMTAIHEQQPNSQFGVAHYKDFVAGCDLSCAYHLDQAITTGDWPTNRDAAQAAINTWEASGGGDDPEAQLYGLHRIATDSATMFRTPQLPRAIAWFGDQPGHNPSGGINLDTAISDLIAAGVRVVAVSVNSSTDPDNPSPGLDACVETSPCPPGQATQIANATGGFVKSNASSSEVAAALLDGLLSATVEPQASCSPTGGISVTFDPVRKVVKSDTNEEATFTETFTVASGASAGKYTCTIDFYVNGKADPNFRQVVTIAVGSTKVGVEAKATSANPNSVADFIYHCPGTAFYPVATAVTRTGGATDIGGGRFSLTFNTNIDAGMVPGGVCTLTALVTDQFERSTPTDDSTTTFNVTKKKPRDVTIYAPIDGQKFGTKTEILATGGGTDPEGGTVTFAWSLTGPSFSAAASGPNATFGPLASTCPTTADCYTLTLTGTDSDGFSSATVKFSVVADSALPPVYGFNGFFPPAKNWPDLNLVNAGAVFTPKWTIRDANGQEVTGPNPPNPGSPIAGALLQRVDCADRDPIGSPVFDWQVGATMVRFDQKGGQWVANVNIPTGAGLCYTWTLELADGSLHPLFLKTK